MDEEWVPTYEKATPLHIGPSQVVVNGESYIPEVRLVFALASIYKTSGNAVLVAKLCDEKLDRSGRLLGLVRDASK